MAPSKPSLGEVRRLMIRCSRGAIPYVHGRGYRWLRGEFIPALELLSARESPEDRELAAEGFYLLGDVHDFNEAPRAAIRAYRRALRLFPQFASAWREIGSMHERMGRRKKARTALRRAVRLDPDDELARTDLECVEEYPTKPFFRAGDPLWESSEWLAEGRPAAALELLSGLRSIKGRLARARAHAAAGDIRRAIQEWTSISEGRGPVGMTSADWFYTGDLLWDIAPFWEALLRLGRRAQMDGVWGIHDSLWEAVRELRKKIDLYARFHLARLGRDTRALASLARRYPRWKEVQRYR